jgi:hypothetical protein
LFSFISSATEDQDDPKLTVDYLEPQSIPVITANDTLDHNQSRLFYESWGRQIYPIRRTVTLSGDEAQQLFDKINSGISSKNANSGWSGHNPHYAITFFDGKKSFVTTFCIEGRTWITREKGGSRRALITKPIELKKMLDSLEKPKVIRIENNHTKSNQ